MENRWLLPFTHSIDDQAIEQVVRRAVLSRATLVPVTLISAEAETQEERLECIRQGKAFQQRVATSARRQHVQFEGHEVFTKDVLPCIKMLVRDVHCSSIVLVTRTQQGGVSLHTHEVRALLHEQFAALVLVRLPEQRNKRQALGKRLLSWLRQFRREQVYTTTARDCCYAGLSNEIDGKERIATAASSCRRLLL